jgi:hypothetical protein
MSMIGKTLGHDQIWIWDLTRRTVTQLTFDENANAFPLWTQDGRQVVYGTRLLSSQRELSMKPADGIGNVQKLGTFSLSPVPSSWSGDGKSVIMEEVPGDAIHVGHKPGRQVHDGQRSQAQRKGLYK